MTVSPVADQLDDPATDPSAVIADVHTLIAPRFRRAEARARAHI